MVFGCKMVDIAVTSERSVSHSCHTSQTLSCFSHIDQPLSSFLRSRPQLLVKRCIWQTCVLFTGSRYRREWHTWGKPPGNLSLKWWRQREQVLQNGLSVLRQSSHERICEQHPGEDKGCNWNRVTTDPSLKRHIQNCGNIWRIEEFRWTIEKENFDLLGEKEYL